MSRVSTHHPDPRVFAALGDPTRLGLVERLRREPGASTTHLAGTTRLTRQGVTKHLVVLEDAGLVRGERRCRERLWTVDPKPFDELAAWLEVWRRGWDARLDRLEAHLSAQKSKPEEPR